jgi:addiction module HigA family antidote
MATKNGLPAIHPGEFLKEMLEELSITQNAFALSIGVSAMRISHVIHGKRPVTAELAVLFGKAFGQTPQFWMNLQTGYDLKVAEKALSRRVSTLRPIYKAVVNA